MSPSVVIPDQEFANPLLAELYDLLDHNRDDLAHYVAMVDEFNVRSVLDLGCGTGVLLNLLANRGLTLIGVDPAQASLHIAQNKSGADQIQWILGSAKALPALNIDLALMTGNVAQVFVDDDDWLFTLQRLHYSLKSQAYLVFETRDPEKQAWTDWTRE